MPIFDKGNFPDKIQVRMTADNNPGRKEEFKHREVPSGEKLLRWAEEVSQCGGKHDRQSIMNNVRNITMNSNFLRLQNEVLRNTGDYLIPDSSWATVSGVERDIPRDVCEDGIQLGEIIFYGSTINHDLSKKSLEEIFKHHCVEAMVRIGKAYEMKPEESVKVLNYYVQRIARNFSQTFGC